MADKKWTKEEILEMWPKSLERLNELQLHIQTKLLVTTITTDQLSMTIQLANQTFEQLKLPICDECGISMKKSERSGGAFICGRCGSSIKFT